MSMLLQSIDARAANAWIMALPRGLHARQPKSLTTLTNFRKQRVSYFWGLEANRSLRDAWIRASVPLSMLAVASSSAMMTASFKIALQRLPFLRVAKCHHAWAPAIEPGQLILVGLRH